MVPLDADDWEIAPPSITGDGDHLRPTYGGHEAHPALCFVPTNRDGDCVLSSIRYCILSNPDLFPLVPPEDPTDPISKCADEVEDGAHVVVAVEQRGGAENALRVG